MMFSIPIIISVSTIIVERGFGTGLEAGTASSLFTVGGTVFSLLFGMMYKKFKKYSIVIVFLITNIGMMLVYFSVNIMMVFIGMFIIGMGPISTPALMVNCQVKCNIKTSEGDFQFRHLRGRRLSR
ncbi:MAG: hypothetical protein ACC608_06450 [Anaerofustis sp.]